MDADRTRPIFLSGKLLRAADLTIEQRFQQESYRLSDGTLHSSGICSGLELFRVGPGRIRVTAGFAFDAAGEQVSLQAPVELDLQASLNSRVWITIRYGETPTEPAGSTRGTFYRRFLVEPVISVRASSQIEDIEHGKELVLGRIELSVFRDIVTIDGSERRIAGVTVGELEFLNPTSQRASVAAGGVPGSLDVCSPITNLFAAVTVAGSVGIFNSVASARPAAGLEIEGIPAIPGHGTIWFEPIADAGTSFPSAKSAPSGSYTVHGNGTYFSGELSIYDTLGVGSASATITNIVGPNLLTVTLLSGTPPTEPTPFVFRPRLLARIRRGNGKAVLAVTASGDVGIGTDFPEAKLHVASGDLGLGANQSLLFAGDGKITSDAGNSAIGFASGSLSIVSQGDVALVSGVSNAASPSTLVIKGSSGNVGIGTTDPVDALTVNGVIEAEGFLFPDGEEQDAAVVSIPIGTILDWWQPAGSTALCPAGFQVCDGGMVVDTSSPLKNTKLPDLTDLFTRAVISFDEVGSTGGSAEHSHTITIAPHDHAIPHAHPITVTFEDATKLSGTPLGASDLSDKSHTHEFGTQPCAWPTIPTGMYSGSETASTDTASAIPSSMYLLKIMRIR